MSYDNRIISNDPYIIDTVNTENRISRKPYAKSPISRGKKQNSSKIFEETLDSIHDASKHENSIEENSEFRNQLYNLSLAKNKTINKLYSSKKDFPSLDSTKITINSELHEKLSQSTIMEVDVSSIYEKIKLLNSLKK